MGVFSAITFAAAVLVCGGLDLFLLPQRHGGEDPAPVSDDAAAADLIGLSSARIYAVAMGVSRDDRDRRRLHVGLEQFRSFGRPDPAVDCLRGHRP